MSITSSTVNVEMAFTDHNERTYKIPVGVEITEETEEQVTEAARQGIRNFNAAIIAEPNGAVAQTFISETGAFAAGIKSGVLVIKDEEVLYNG